MVHNGSGRPFALGTGGAKANNDDSDSESSQESPGLGDRYERSYSHIQEHFDGIHEDEEDEEFETRRAFEENKNGVDALFQQISSKQAPQTMPSSSYQTSSGKIETWRQQGELASAAVAEMHRRVGTNAYTAPPPNSSLFAGASADRAEKKVVSFNIQQDPRGGQINDRSSNLRVSVDDFDDANDGDEVSGSTRIQYPKTPPPFKFTQSGSGADASSEEDEQGSYIPHSSAFGYEQGGDYYNRPTMASSSTTTNSSRNANNLQAAGSPLMYSPPAPPPQTPPFPVPIRKEATQNQPTNALGPLATKSSASPEQQQRSVVQFNSPAMRRIMNSPGISNRSTLNNR
jgi:hypothetical protein